MNKQTSSVHMSTMVLNACGGAAVVHVKGSPTKQVVIPGGTALADAIEFPGSGKKRADVSKLRSTWGMLPKNPSVFYFQLDDGSLALSNGWTMSTQSGPHFLPGAHAASLTVPAAGQPIPASFQASAEAVYAPWPAGAPDATEAPCDARPPMEQYSLHRLQSNTMLAKAQGDIAVTLRPQDLMQVLASCGPRQKTFELAPLRSTGLAPAGVTRNLGLISEASTQYAEDARRINTMVDRYADMRLASLTSGGL